jgi:UDP-glucose 4-epimerase
VPLKVLITGGSGFIGRNLVESLAGFYEINAPARSELDLLNDALVRDYLVSNRFDVVLNAVTGRSNRKTTAPDLFKNNCRMFFNLARNRHLFGKMLHFGSGAEFGVRVPRMSEQLFDTYVPGDDYGFAKYIAAKFIESVQANLYNLRLFAVFGKYEAWDVRFISNAICRVLFDLPIMLRQNACFDYLYISDLAKIVSWFIENDSAHKTYNVCRGESHEILWLARAVAEVSGRNPEIRVARDGLAPEYSGDNTRMLSEMKGFTFTPIKQAIRELYAWYEAHLSLIDTEALRFDG